MTTQRLSDYAFLDTQEKDSGIDLAPMLDVVFILLIFFIVTASFVKEAAIDLSRPDVLLNPDPDIKSITLRIDASGAYSVNDYYTTPDGLASYLRRMRSELPEASFSILASPDATTDQVVTAADRARVAGYLDVPLRLMEVE